MNFRATLTIGISQSFHSVATLFKIYLRSQLNICMRKEKETFTVEMEKVQIFRHLNLKFHGSNIFRIADDRNRCIVPFDDTLIAISYFDVAFVVFVVAASNSGFEDSFAVCSVCGVRLV